MERFFQKTLTANPRWSNLEHMKRIHVYVMGPIADEMVRNAKKNRRSFSQEVNFALFAYYTQFAATPKPVKKQA